MKMGICVKVLCLCRWRACEYEPVPVCFIERQISIFCALNNRANQPTGSCLIKR